jgi:hypothetical protein
MVLQDSNLALHSEGIKMTVAAEQPHFLAVDDDALGTGVVIYRLQVHIHVCESTMQNKHLCNDDILVYVYTALFMYVVAQTFLQHTICIYM